MQGYAKFIFSILSKVLCSTVAIVSVIYDEGRRSLLDWLRARADLEMLAVEEKRMHIEAQRAIYLVQIAKEIGIQTKSDVADLVITKLINSSETKHH